MDSHNLVRMVNQIALNVSAYPREEAIARTASHLQKFWDPRMRRQLRHYVNTGGSELSELAVEAEKRLTTPVTDEGD